MPSTLTASGVHPGSPLAAARFERVALDWALRPERGVLLVRGDVRPFALVGAWAGGGAVVGSEPVRVLAAHDDPFAALDEHPAVRLAGPGVASGAVGGGWFGVLGFGLAQRLERLDPPPPRPVPLPDADLAFYDHVLRCDADGAWWFEALWTPERDGALAARLAELERRAAAGPALRPVSTAPWQASPSPAGHAVAVAACRARIAEGDLFQANLALRLESTLRGDLVDLFVRGTAALAPERAAFVAGPDGAVASLSPELFLAREGRDVLSAPIKGTRPRQAEDPEAAAATRAELVASEKDRAENVMIVDLVRNDLGRVCRPGSVRVAALAAARAHVGVWHLVSEVEGRLRDGVGDAELVRATFPPGSVTGAPKVAALDVISELESTGREAYTGAIGFASPLAGLELNVAIRTFEARGERIWLEVGGGVVADSDPQAEAAESLAKAAPLLRAVGGELAPAAPSHGYPAAPGRVAPRPAGVGAGADHLGPRPIRLGPRPVARPDPAGGVFETILLSEGRAIAGDLHLDRLAASLRALYGAELSGDAGAALARAAAAVAAPARARLAVRAPEGDGVPAVSLEVEPLPAPFPPASTTSLRSVALPGGLGAHKWRDRRLLDALGARTAPATPLLVDLDGSVLEAAWASVFVVDAAGHLRTPPADGRILPGITRARVLSAAAGLGVPVRVGELPLELVHAAAEIFVTSALRGVHPVSEVDDVALQAPGAVTRALADALTATAAPRSLPPSVADRCARM